MDPITLTVFALALGAGVWQGSEQQSAQKEGLRRQQAAQSQAQASALSQQRRADEQMRAANRKAPDISSLLAFEQAMPSFGAGPTAPAADPSRLRLGRASLLGTP